MSWVIEVGGQGIQTGPPDPIPDVYLARHRLAGTVECGASTFLPEGRSRTERAVGRKRKRAHDPAGAAPTCRTRRPCWAPGTGRAGHCGLSTPPAAPDVRAALDAIGSGRRPAEQGDPATARVGSPVADDRPLRANP